MLLNLHLLSEKNSLSNCTRLIIQITMMKSDARDGHKECLLFVTYWCCCRCYCFLTVFRFTRLECVRLIVWISVSECVEQHNVLSILCICPYLCICGGIHKNGSDERANDSHTLSTLLKYDTPQILCTAFLLCLHKMPHRARSMHWFHMYSLSLCENVLDIAFYFQPSILRLSFIWLLN